MHQIDKDEFKKMIDDRVVFLMENLSIGEFIKKLNAAMKINDTSAIKELMLPEFCPKITHDKKEQMIFKHVSTSAVSKLIGKDFLHYLIFEYKISEANSIDSITVDDKIEGMFQARKLDEELRTELVDTKNQVKKPKV